ncbi:YihY/virulence factor BrkB family protein [Myxacorys almedinensis]|uniref:Ribonuclease BN n=1 Tax=Myxacorys almedinensis A TaxID=2690445 RepID=A0A8J8CIL9_9CYAN|nr:YihY/virulence factor BrkB family protein [Myxacorys almedinensis]NDJ17988.1 ribonuclease BN [Myxacorys almedinensis A]
MLHYIRSTLIPSKPAQLLIQTGMKWDQDNCSGMAASLSYFALFSLFPLLLVMLSIIGRLIAPGTDAFQEIQRAVARHLPPEVHGLIKETVISLSENRVGAGIVGFSVLLWTASAVFDILRSSVNKIWRLPLRGTAEQLPSRVSETGSATKMVLFFVANKLFSFLLVFGTGLLLFASLISNIAIKAILKLVVTFQEAFSWIQLDEFLLTRSLQTGSSFLILAIALCILYKILPTVYVSWGDVWLGALLVALLLVGLQQLVSNSVISIGSHFLSYGVIGGVMILLLWIFLTCQIFLFGCVFSYVYAHLVGSRRRQSLNQSSETE